MGKATNQSKELLLHLSFVFFCYLASGCLQPLCENRAICLILVEGVGMSDDEMRQLIKARCCSVLSGDFGEISVRVVSSEAIKLLGQVTAVLDRHSLYHL